MYDKKQKIMKDIDWTEKNNWIFIFIYMKSGIFTLFSGYKKINRGREIRKEKFEKKNFITKRVIGTYLHEIVANQAGRLRASF